MKLNSIISKSLITCNKDCNICEASIIMKKNDIGFLPITDTNKIIGVITDRDIVTCMLANSENKDCKVINYANKNIISIDIKSSIIDVLELMELKQIKRILVTSNSKVEGVISLSDIFNSDIDAKLVYETLKKIFMNHKIANDKVQIDDFYL